MTANISILPPFGTAAFDADTLAAGLKKLKKARITRGVAKAEHRHLAYLKPGERKRIKAAKARKRVRQAARRQAAWEAIHVQ